MLSVLLLAFAIINFEATIQLLKRHFEIDILEIKKNSWFLLNLKVFFRYLKSEKIADLSSWMTADKP